MGRVVKVIFLLSQTGVLRLAAHANAFDAPVSLPNFSHTNFFWLKFNHFLILNLIKNYADSFSMSLGPWPYVQPQTVGKDSGVPFCLSYFEKDISQPKNSKMPTMSSLRQYKTSLLITIIVNRSSKIHISWTAYMNFDLKRFLSLFPILFK